MQNPEHRLIPFGVSVVDDKLGGVLPGKPYLLYGSHGSGKLLYCLKFLWAGLNRGEHCCFVVSHDPDGLVYQASNMGFDLQRFLISDQLVILRYKPRLEQMVSRLESFDGVMAELRGQVNSQNLCRLCFYTVEPLVNFDDRVNIGIRMRLLTEGINATGLTTLTVEEGVSAEKIRCIVDLSKLVFGAFRLARGGDNLPGICFEKAWWGPREDRQQLESALHDFDDGMDNPLPALPGTPITTTAQISLMAEARSIIRLTQKVEPDASPVELRKGLLSAEEFSAKLLQESEKARDDSSSFSLAGFYFDHGGDSAVVRQLRQFITSSLREGELCHDVREDLFLICLEDCDEPAARRFYDRFSNRIRERFAGGNVGMKTTITTFPDDAGNLQELISKTMLALGEDDIGFGGFEREGAEDIDPVALLGEDRP